MLTACGVETADELFSHLPEAVKLNRPLNLEPGISEYEIVDYFRARAEQNAAGYPSFLGAGVYRHFRPVLVDTVVSRVEFLTSYTPYQAEISQGTLTTIFEFQTMICQLTGMDVANASMYDGSTAVPEAALMAVRATNKGRVLVAKSVHPEYRDVLATYAKHQGMPVEEFGYVAEAGTIDLEDLDRKMDDLTAAVIVQSPNFFATMIDAVQSPSPTGLTWCNDTPHKVMAAVGTDDGKSVVSRGWYRVDPGKCLHPDITGQPKQVYSFAEAVDADNRTIKLKDKPLNWGGTRQLCTRESKFETNEQGDCASRGFATNGFAAVDLASGGKTLRFAVP